MEHRDIFFLQETLGEGDCISKPLESFFISWKCISLDARGRLGGLFLGWDSWKILVQIYWSISFGLGVVEFSIELDSTFTFINLYGPNNDRVHFWNYFFRKSMLGDAHLIIGGDLNYSTRATESWGSQAIFVSLSDFFSHKIDANYLINLIPINLHPTWRNHHVCEGKVAKYWTCLG